MGCGDSQPEASIGEEYAAKNLIQPGYTEYENEFEKQLFMAINLCRNNPKSYIGAVKKCAATHELCKELPTKELITFLQTCEQLSHVTFDEQANQACRQNNTTIIEKDEETPTKGGNVEAFKALAGEDQVCQEYTMCKYMGDSAKEFIALQLILDWNREGDLAKRSPVVEKQTGRVGISNKAHKKTKNLIQILYI